MPLKKVKADRSCPARNE